MALELGYLEGGHLYFGFELYVARSLESVVLATHITSWLHTTESTTHWYDIYIFTPTCKNYGQKSI